jgi:transposase
MGIAAILDENQRLRDLLAERDAALVARDAALAEKDAAIESLKEINDSLAKRLELIRLKLVSRRNERFEDDGRGPEPLFPGAPPPPPRRPEPETTPLVDGADASEASEPPAEPVPSNGPGSKGGPGQGKPRRRRLAERDDLPTRRDKVAIDPSTTCAGCGKGVKVFADATTWRLEWVPGHFERIATTRERCACPSCPGQGVLVAPDPFALPKALCGDGLLARVLVDKFGDHLALNRQATRMEREGETFSTTTLSAWVRGGAGILRSVADAVHGRLLRGPWLQIDDTGMPVQDGTDGALRKGRLWAVTDQQEVSFVFTGTKHGKHPAEFLEKFKGKLLLADRGSEFNQLVRDNGLERAGCWSHLRRYFFDARVHHPNEAGMALLTIRDLFAIEASVQGASAADVLAVRQRDSRPLVDGLFTWMERMGPHLRPKSSLGDAIAYALNGRASFRVFLDHGELPMHNNMSELQLRQAVVGRKNWLFAGSEGGAVAAATCFTLIGSCMLQGVDPWAYLVDVLPKVSSWPVNRLHLLTPLGWRLAREGAPPG